MEEERLKREAKAKEQRQKELDDIRARITEAIEALAKRKEFRALNLDAAKARLDFDVKKLDAAIKKNEGLIKKLRMITAENKDSIMKGIREINMSKFVSESVDAVGEANMKGKDIPAAVQIVSMLHLRYTNFASGLSAKLAGAFAPPKPETLASETDGERKERLTKRRTALRLITELLAAGVFTEGTLLVTAVREVISQERAMTDGGATLSALLVAFTKYAGEDMLGLRPAWRVDLEALVERERRKAVPEGEGEGGAGAEGVGEGGGDGGDGGGEGGGAGVPGDVEELLELAGQVQGFAAVDEGSRGKVREVVEGAFGAMCKELVEQHKNLRARERDNRKKLALKGDLSDETMKAFEKRKAEYEKLKTSASALSEALQLPLPEFPPDPEDETRIADAGVWLPGGGDGEEEDFGDNVFEDADTRDFYLSVPDIFEVVPAVLLGEAAVERARKAAEGGGEGEGKGEGEGEKEKEEEKEEEYVPSEVSVPLEEKDDKDAADDISAVERAKMDDFCMQLEDCQSRDLIDKAAQDFCYMNTKGNRKRLARALFAVPRTAYNLIPYYARFIAILTPAMPDIPEMVSQWLEKEFFSYVKVKADGVLENRLKNIRFLAELVKFKLVRPGVIFNCLQRCLDDFTLHNIEVACNLLEVAGRFMYRTKQTHVRTQNMLDVMMRLKNAKNLDSRFDTMVQNAFFVCKPPQRSAKSQKKKRPMEHEYIRHLFFARLNKTNVEEIVKQLRKVDWKANGAYVVKCILKVQKCKYNQVYLLASLVASLTRYHPHLPIHVVDDLLAELRHLLHANQFTKQQRMLSLTKLLGELYNDLVVDSAIIFDALYTFISPGTEHSGPLPDPQGDHFRIRLVCVLLDTCGHYFDSGLAAKRLNLFLARFERYIITKAPVPMDVEFAVSDTLDTLRPSKDRLRTLEAADALIQGLVASEQKLGLPAGLEALDVKASLVQSAGGKEGGEDSGGDSDSDREEKDVDSDDERTGQRRAKSLLEGKFGMAMGEEGAEETDDFRYQDGMDGDEAVVLVRKERQLEHTAEDDDFEKEFSKMMLNSQPAGPRRNLDVTIPLNLQSDSGNAPKVVTAPDGQERVVFQMLTRKGNKAATKELAIPRESALAATSMERGNAEEEEKRALKHKVLSYQNEVDFQKAGGMGFRRY